MNKLDFEIKRSGKNVTISKMITLTGEQLASFDVKPGETLTLDVKTVIDVEELLKLIGQDSDPGKPGLRSRLTDAALLEIMRRVISMGIDYGKSAIGG